MLAGNQPPVDVAGEPIGVVCRLMEDGRTFPRRPLQPLIVADVAEQEVSAFLPPKRSFGHRSTTVTVAQPLNFLIRRYDAFQRSRNLLDKHACLLIFQQRLFSTHAGAPDFTPRSTGLGHTENAGPDTDMRAWCMVAADSVKSVEATWE